MYSMLPKYCNKRAPKTISTRMAQSHHHYQLLFIYHRPDVTLRELVLFGNGKSCKYVIIVTEKKPFEQQHI